MIYNQRSDDVLKTELEYLREYIGRVFGRELEKEAFQSQLEDMISQKIQDYVFQRYRDWTAPELARLKAQWDKPEQIAQPVTSDVTAPRRGRPPKVDRNSQQ